MLSRKQYMHFKTLGASMISVLLMISFVGLSPSAILAQGTNVTNTSNATQGTNVTNISNATSTANTTGTAGGGGGTTIVMPLGSSSSTGGQGYQPDQITVSPGATVIWDNQDNALHTATSGNPDTATPDGKFDTGLLGANQQSKPVTMPTEPGDYVYFCTLHPFLVGTITVQ
jgi:plastocyanin